MERMDKRYLIAIIVAAIVVVALVIIIPNLGNDDDNTAVPTQDGSGASAPAISPDATMPADHPSVEGDTGIDAASLEEMTKAAEDAYNADPKNVEAILALADIYAMAQKSDEVERLLNEALAVEPDNSQANATLAMIQFEKGDTDGAEARLIAVIDTNPDDQTALYDLGIVYFSTNQRDKAKEIWSKAAEVDPSTEFGQLASQFIQMMEQSGSTGASPHGASTPTTTQ
jgi:tetratricopeptide (TPR) repeat protein